MTLKALDVLLPTRNTVGEKSSSEGLSLVVPVTNESALTLPSVQAISDGKETDGQVIDVSATVVAETPEPVDNRIADLAASAFPTKTFGGIADMIPELEHALRTGTYEEYSDLIEPVRLAEEFFLARSTSEAKADLIEALAKEPLTPENERLWIRLVDDLTPGPYSDLICKHIADVDIADREIDTRLRQIRQEWERYGDNSPYEPHIKRLDRVIAGKQAKSLGSRLESAIASAKGFLTSLLPNPEATDEPTRPVTNQPQVEPHDPNPSNTDTSRPLIQRTGLSTEETLLLPPHNETPIDLQ